MKEFDTKISVVVPYYENRPEKRGMLYRAVDSFRGYDELLLIWNDKMGFSKAVNTGYRLAKGDFIIMASDDCYVEEGSLRDLAVGGFVTSPVVNKISNDFSGVMWCVPREIYEQYGMLDEGYSEGILYEDEDYLNMLRFEGISHKCVESVRIIHPEGGATLTRDPEFRRKADINLSYFNDKWKDRL